MTFRYVQNTTLTLNDLERSKRTCNLLEAQRSAHVSSTDLLVNPCNVVVECDAIRNHNVAIVFVEIKLPYNDGL